MTRGKNQQGAGRVPRPSVVMLSTDAGVMTNAHCRRKVAVVADGNQGALILSFAVLALDPQNWGTAA